MANEKISELPSGAPVQGADALVIARAGTNYSVAASQVAGLLPGFDVQIGGNTTGTTANISTGTLFLAGGNNITLSQVGNALTISGASQQPTFSAGVSTGGNTTGATGITGSQLVLAGGNNVTLSQSAGPNGATVTVSAANQLPVVNASLGGNTTGTLALVSSGTLVLAGGNNITLSQNGNSVTISANTAAPANLSVSAGTTSGTFGGITLSNLNGVSFGLNNGTITASVSQSAQTQNIIDVTLGGNTSGTLALISSGTMFLAGGNNVTLSQVGNSVTISANTAAAATLSVSAGTTSGGFGGITLANSNNVSFGLNNGTITANAAELISAGTTSGSYSAFTLSNSNNLSFGIDTNGVITGSASQSVQTQASGHIAGTGFTSTTTGGTALVGTLNTAGLSVGVPEWLTAASGQFSGGVSNIGNSAGNTGITGTQLVLAGGNGVTLSQVTGANGGTVTISISQTNQSLGIYASSQTVGQSSSSTVDARSFTHVGQGNISVGLSGASLLISGSQSAQSLGIYASSQTTAQSSSGTVDARSLTVVGAGIISVGLSQQSLIISAPASTGISQSLYATGNTTQSSSGTASIGSLLVQGTGGVSVGVSNGSLVISGAAGAGGAGAAPGMSTFGNTAGTTGTFSAGTYVLVGTGPVSLSQSTNTNGATLSINAPATSSLSATGWASISTNGSTISVGAVAPQLSFFQPLGPAQSTTVTQQGNGSVQVYPAIAAFPFSASRADMMVSVSLTNLGVSTEAQSLSMFVGLYSLNGSTLSLASSGSQSYAWTNSSGNSNASISGMRRFSAPINVNYTGGFDLFVGMMSSTTFANTQGISMSNVVVPLGPGPQLQGLIGQVPANSMQFVPGQGIFSATSAAMPASMGLSALSGAGSGGNAVDYYSPLQFVNVTA